MHSYPDFHVQFSRPSVAFAIRQPCFFYSSVRFHCGKSVPRSQREATNTHHHETRRTASSNFMQSDTLPVGPCSSRSASTKVLCSIGAGKGHTHCAVSIGVVQITHRPLACAAGDRPAIEQRLCLFLPVLSVSGRQWQSAIQNIHIADCEKRPARSRLHKPRGAHKGCYEKNESCPPLGQL